MEFGEILLKLCLFASRGALVWASRIRMPMLSGQTRTPSRTAPAQSALRFQPCPDGVSFALSGTPVRALAEGALWVEGAAALIVSDLHLEKATSLARGGCLLPPYDTRATLQQLGGLIGRLAPKLVLSLGDSFHDGAGPERLDPEDRAHLLALMAGREWVWIEGNHDHASPAALGGCAALEWELMGLVFRHEPLPGAAPEVAGHLHPCARVSGPSGSLRRRCFLTDGRRLIMPAMGALTGGLNVRDAAFAPLLDADHAALLLHRNKVFPASRARLQPD